MPGGRQGYEGADYTQARREGKGGRGGGGVEHQNSKFKAIVFCVMAGAGVVRVLFFYCSNTRSPLCRAARDETSRWQLPCHSGEGRYRMRTSRDDSFPCPRPQGAGEWTYSVVRETCESDSGEGRGPYFGARCLWTPAFAGVTPEFGLP